MSVLVLGGAGYIGSHTVYALIEKEKMLLSLIICKQVLNN